MICVTAFILFGLSVYELRRPYRLRHGASDDPESRVQDHPGRPNCPVESPPLREADHNVMAADSDQSYLAPQIPTSTTDCSENGYHRFPAPDLQRTHQEQPFQDPNVGKQSAQYSKGGHIAPSWIPPKSVPNPVSVDVEAGPSSSRMLPTQGTAERSHAQLPKANRNSGPKDEQGRELDVLPSHWQQDSP